MEVRWGRSEVQKCTRIRTSVPWQSFASTLAKALRHPQKASLWLGIKGTCCRREFLPLHDIASTADYYVTGNGSDGQLPKPAL